MDYDYVHRLSDSEREYLEKFSDEVYGATFDKDPLHTDPEQRKALAREKNYRREDIMGRGLRRSREVGPADAWATDETDAQSVPSYLNNPDYKEAINDFRRSLPEDRREITLPGPAFSASEARLSAVSGVSPRPLRGDLRMAKNRLAKLQHTREVLFRLGVVVARHQFTGDESRVAAGLMDWLETNVLKLDKKLAAAGIQPPPGMEIKKAGE